MTDLPTIEQCRAFMDAINAGRVALGLPTIQKLEYDDCYPDDAEACLSAHHLFHPDGAPGINGRVLDRVVGGLTSSQTEVLGVALGTRVVGGERFPRLVIPPVIRAVTDPFDAGKEDLELAEALRERLVEAGLVA